MIFAASRLMALSNASGPSSRPPLICPRSAILQSAAASSVAGIFEFTVSTAARIATFGRSTPNDLRQVDRVLADVHLVLERRRDVDRGVGDDQHLVVGRHVHQEDVAEAPAGAQAGLLGARPRRAARRCAGCPSSAARPCPRAPAPPPWRPRRGCRRRPRSRRRRGRCPWPWRARRSSPRARPGSG